MYTKMYLEIVHMYKHHSHARDLSPVCAYACAQGGDWNVNKWYRVASAIN